MKVSNERAMIRGSLVSEMRVPLRAQWMSTITAVFLAAHEEEALKCGNRGLRIFSEDMFATAWGSGKRKHDTTVAGFC